MRPGQQQERGGADQQAALHAGAATKPAQQPYAGPADGQQVDDDVLEEGANWKLADMPKPPAMATMKARSSSRRPGHADRRHQREDDGDADGAGRSRRGPRNRPRVGEQAPEAVRASCAASRAVDAACAWRAHCPACWPVAGSTPGAGRRPTGAGTQLGSGRRRGRFLLASFSVWFWLIGLSLCIAPGAGASAAIIRHTPERGTWLPTARCGRPGLGTVASGPAMATGRP